MAFGETSQAPVQTAMQLPAEAPQPAPLSSQPRLVEPMKPMTPQEDETAPTLRGGRSEACPGRFCFIIPCPIPCDFCII